MIMKMENEMKYVAPTVETLEVGVESGFEASVAPPESPQDPGAFD